MSLSPALLRAAGGGGGGALFRHEARRDGKVVATLEGIRQEDGSVVVEATVTAIGAKPADAIKRPFPFPQPDVARRFADETLQALEFLGCDVAE